MNVRIAAGYDAAFQTERINEYPVMDALEARFGYAVDRQRLEGAARVLACPLKKNPPNWQHGRLVYALTRHYLAREPGAQYWLDIGTAKGFSACVMAWALDDARREGRVLSLDIIHPDSREPRNSVEDGKTIEEFTRDFIPMGSDVMFMQGAAGRVFDAGGAPERIGFAFIDGSHTYEGVRADIETVAARQQNGDIVLFDDLQVPGVERAIGRLGGYEKERIELLANRRYCIAVKI